MTPKRFFDSEGGAFPFTVLDDRAGLRHDRGCYIMAEDGTSVDHLPRELLTAIRDLCRQGEQLLESGKFEEAFGVFNRAYLLIPEPREKWNATGWILVAMGETAVRAGAFESAEGPLTDAMWCPGTIGNPWVHLRRGQVAYELGKLDRATDELARAWMGGMRAIFEGLDPKYFALVEKVLQPPIGMDRLP